MHIMCLLEDLYLLEDYIKNSDNLIIRQPNLKMGKRLNFSRGDTQMDKKPRKVCLTSLVIGKCKLKVQ